jgi:competence protein ComEC
VPLVTLLFLTYTGGLLLGFSGNPGTAVAGLALLIATSRGRRGDAWLAVLVGGAGLLTAGGATEDDRSCRRRVLREGRAVLVLATPLEPGRSATGHVVDGCRVPVRISAVTRLPSGSVILAEGLFSRSGDALALRGGQVTLVRGPGLLPRLRSRAGLLLDELYREHAPLARALIIADQRDIPPDLRDRFADAGIIHMLSVSGLHVSIVAGALLAMLSAVGMTARQAMIGSVVVTAIYVLIIGSPPPAVRSAGMCALATCSRLLQRPTSAWAVWAGSSALSLVEPRIALDLGWQLSVSGMAGLIASGTLVQRLALPLSGWKAALAGNMIATVVASVASAPLCAWVFGRISVAAVATNLAAAPLFNIVQPLLFASVVTGPLRPVAGFLADAARSGLLLVDLVARIGASLPGAVFRSVPNGPGAIAAGIAAAAIIVACQVRRPRRALQVAFGATMLGTVWPMIARGPGVLEAHIIDVGQGDAVALRSPRGRWLVVDAGGAWKTGDAATFSVLPVLRRAGGDVVHLVLTHPHLDHIGGAKMLLTSSEIDTLWEPAFVEPNREYADLLREAQMRRVVWRAARPGTRLDFDGVSVRVLAPDSAWAASTTNPNDASVVLQIGYGAVRMLLTGDAERRQEEWLVRQYRDSLRSTILKLGHHGSSTSSTPVFLDAVQPDLAVVSVGTGNRYGHPSPAVLQALDERGTHVLRTDDVGTIMLRTDGRTVDLVADGRRWRYSVDSSGAFSVDQRSFPRR